MADQREKADRALATLAAVVSEVTGLEATVERLTGSETALLRALDLMEAENRLLREESSRRGEVIARLQVALDKLAKQEPAAAFVLGKTYNNRFQFALSLEAVREYEKNGFKCEYLYLAAGAKHD